MKALTKFFDILTRIMMYISMAILCAVLLTVVFNIIARSFFNFAIGGINEIVRYGVMSAMSFGLARCAFNNGHVVVNIILKRFPNKVRGAVALVEMLIAAAIFAVTAVTCINVIPDAVSHNLVTDVYKVPFEYVYLVLIIGLVVSGLVFVYKAIDELIKGFTVGFDDTPGRSENAGKEA